jgi:hypothetical protein
MNWKRLVVLLLLVVVLAGCLPGDGASSPDAPAGFFSGVWHGWIAPISLIVSIFNEDIGIYEVDNTGGWYDFGFYMAIIGGFGGLRLFRSKKQDDD